MSDLVFNWVLVKLDEIHAIEIKEYLNIAERPRGMRIENMLWNCQLGADC